MGETMKNKTILITGATSGIGWACAEAFAAQGARLVLCGRRIGRLAEIQKKLSPAAVYAAPLDVGDRDAVAAFFANIPPEFHTIDVLVNNAGGALGLDPAWEADLNDWDDMVDANIKGLLYMTRAALPSMVARDSGHIINIGSIAGEYYYAGGNAYGGAKAFVKQFSGNLRADLLGKNVRVTNIEPGAVETEFSLVRFHGDKTRAESVYAGYQALTAADIANAVVWCAAQPPHVNVNRLEIMPVMQASAGFTIKRNA